MSFFFYFLCRTGALIIPPMHGNSTLSFFLSVFLFWYLVCDVWSSFEAFAFAHFTEHHGFNLVQNANYLACDHKSNFYINNFGVVHNQDRAFHIHIHLFAYLKCNKASAVHNTLSLWMWKRTRNSGYKLENHWDVSLCIACCLARSVSVRWSFRGKKREREYSVCLDGLISRSEISKWKLAVAR